jgi:hypothetical protein
MKIQIDVSNYKVNYIGFRDLQHVRSYLKNILPLDYVNIKLNEGLEVSKWNDFFNVMINEKSSDFWFSGKVGVVLNDYPAIVSTYKGNYFNINII